MKKLLLSFISLGITSSLLFGLTNAFFSDTESSTGNTLEAGAFDLLIDGQNNPTAIVNFNDLKPGDNFEEDKTITLQNPGYVWMHLISYQTGQGVQTEPETLEENGTPKFDIDQYIDYDLSTPSATLISQEDQIPFEDVFSCWIPLGEFPAGDSFITQSFHFDPTVTNWAQGDTLTFSEEFYAVQSRNNPNPTPPPSESGRTWDPVNKICEDCVPQQSTVYASSVVSSNILLRKNGTPVLPARSNPANALNAPDGNGAAGTGFLSLGYGGSVVLKFANPVYDGAGADITFHEITNGRNTYPLETALVEVSADNVTWFALTPNATSEPGVGGDGIVGLDISSNGSAPSSILYVRVTDQSNPASNPAADSDGYDLDALSAQYSSCASAN